MALFRVFAPYVLLIVIGKIILDVVDSTWLYVAASVAYWYLLAGAYVVFVRKKTPSQQRQDSIDFKGAARNLYYCIWWPWFLARKG